MKYKDHHKSYAEYIQRNTKIKDRQNPGKILFLKAASKQQDAKSDHNEHQLVGNRHDHKNDRRDRDRNLFFFHKIDLHRLTACRRRRDTAEEKTDRRDQKTQCLFYADAVSPQHIPDDERLPPDKYENTSGCRKKPPHFRLNERLLHFIQIFSVKHSIHGKSQNGQKQDGIPNYFLFIIHLYSLRFLFQVQRFIRPLKKRLIFFCKSGFNSKRIRQLRK